MIKNRNILIAIALTLIFLLAFTVRYIPSSKYDTRLLTNWGDDWWFLGIARYFADRHVIPEVEPTYGNGIKFIYPPGLMLVFAVLTQFTGVELVYLGKYMAIFLGAFTVVLVYVLAEKLSKDYRVGLLAAVLAATSIRYLTRTAGFCSELMGHLLIPIIMLFLYMAFEEKKKAKYRMHILIAGIMFGGLILAHHLSSAVAIVVLSFLSLLLLVFKRKKGLEDIKKIIAVVLIGFAISSLFWIELAQEGIMNIVVREAYGRSGLNNLETFTGHIGIPQLFLGFAGIILALYLRKKEHLMLLAWAIPPFIGLWDRTIAKAIVNNTFLKAYPDLVYLFSPSLYTRYFDFLAQAWAILGAILVVYVLTRLKKIKWIKEHTTLISIVVIATILLTMPLPFNTKLYKSGGYRWLGFAMKSFVDPEEYEAAVWMRENLRNDVNILSDYEANEMILGVTGKTVANGGTLRATLPVGTIYTDHLIIYFTSDLQEALDLIDKYEITHVFLSERMEDKGWFCVEHNSRFDYSYGGDMEDADLEKFEESDCFEPIYDKNKVKIYRINYDCEYFS